jgi:hypothetical protein
MKIKKREIQKTVCGRAKHQSLRTARSMQRRSGARLQTRQRAVAPETTE